MQRMTTTEPESDEEMETSMEDMEAAFQFFRAFMSHVHGGGGAFERRGGGQGSFGGPGIGIFVPAFFGASGPSPGCSPPLLSCGKTLLGINLGVTHAAGTAIVQTSCCYDPF